MDTWAREEEVREDNRHGFFIKRRRRRLRLVTETEESLASAGDIITHNLRCICLIQGTCKCNCRSISQSGLSTFRRHGRKRSHGAFLKFG